MSVDKLLLGLQNRIPADQFAAEIGDLLWPSTPVSDGPHAELLRLADATHQLSDEAILATAYAELAQCCIASRGFWFDATDEEGIVGVARNFIARHRGETVRRLGAHQSEPGAPVRVAPIRWSDCFQVLDGHHRVASAAVSGVPSLTARLKWIPVTTPLQRMLHLPAPPAKRLLYQPVEAPEVSAYWTARPGAQHNLEAMSRFLGRRNLLPPGLRTFLDVGSCYGWLVGQMNSLGFQASGVDRDAGGRSLASALYGVEPECIHIAEPDIFLARTDLRWDLVAYLSVRDKCLATLDEARTAAVLRLLDRVTDHVLVVSVVRRTNSGNTGGGSREHVTAPVPRLLRNYTSFDQFVRLATRKVRRGPGSRGQVVELYACVRQ